MIQLGLNIFLKFADENFVVCFSVVKELIPLIRLSKVFVGCVCVCVEGGEGGGGES